MPEAAVSRKLAVHEEVPVEFETKVHGEPVKLPGTPDSLRVT